VPEAEERKEEQQNNGEEVPNQLRAVDSLEEEIHN